MASGRRTPCLKVRTARIEGLGLCALPCGFVCGFCAYRAAHCVPAGGSSWPIAGPIAGRLTATRPIRRADFFAVERRLRPHQPRNAARKWRPHAGHLSEVMPVRRRACRRGRCACSGILRPAAGRAGVLVRREARLGRVVPIAKRSPRSRPRSRRAGRDGTGAPAGAAFRAGWAAGCRHAPASAREGAGSHARLISGRARCWSAFPRFPFCPAAGLPGFSRDSRAPYRGGELREAGKREGSGQPQPALPMHQEATFNEPTDCRLRPFRLALGFAH